MASLTLHCLIAAAAAYQVSVPALQAIRTVEGGQERQEVCGNYDGSCDLGPFQVNDKAWVGTLAAALGADRRVVRTTLRDDGCWNAQVASWILRQELDAAGGNQMEAIGNYHSHFRRPHYAYLRRIYPIIETLDPYEPPPALPDAEPDDSPGAMRIPPDVAGPAPPPTPARPAEEPKGKMIRVGKPPANVGPSSTGSGAPQPSSPPASDDSLD
ncbi:MAG TPA: lytic transglycosylase domain-containing protein, partial [Stellaceae bacterium]|nr:lytic transglycosylase domain-containing protein [Stellaceae bacterium]